MEKHLTTILILLGGIFIPYVIGRYLIFREKPNDIGDILFFWWLGVVISLLFTGIGAVYISIYQSL